MRFNVGEQIGPYRVSSLLGVGGMGEVYRAWDPRLSRDVAIKVLSAERGGEREIVRFMQEARAASALTHPNVVTVHEVGQQDEIHYVVMEIVDGERLRDVLRRGPLSLQRSLEIALSITEGLAAAHERGIVHRDLKPENVMITHDGRVKLLDFGLAKVRTEEVSEDAVTAQQGTLETESGIVIGTAAYMSPEQGSGAPVDFRSDQFAFGVLLHEMLTGTTPFRRDTRIETLYAILREEPSPIPLDVPDGVATIVERCLSKQPAGRYASTRDLAWEVQNELFNLSSASRSRSSRRSSRGQRRPPRRYAIAAVVALMVVIASAVGYVHWSDESAVDPIPGQKQLAILPFTSLGDDESSRLLGDGLTQVVSASLSSFGGIQVMAPYTSSSEELRDDVRTIARRLGANLVLKGTFQRHGDGVRISYSLLDPATGVQLAADTIHRMGNDLFAVQEELAGRLASDLRLTAQRPSLMHVNPQLNGTAAQDRYLQALGLLQRYDHSPSIDRAVVILEELEEWSPRSALIQAALGRAHLHRFMITHDPDAAERAAEYCARAEKLDSDLPDVHVTRGELALRTGRTSAAVESFQQALRSYPESAEATLGLAESLARSGDSAAAEKAYQRAIDLRPAFWGGFNRRGAFYLQLNDTERAITNFERAIALSPDNARAHANLSAALIRAGRLPEAISASEASVEIFPTAGAWSNLGTALYMSGRFDDAAASFEKATGLAPNRAILWVNYGDALRWSSRRKGEAGAVFARAIALSEEALELNPEDVGLRIAIAEAYAKSGKPAEAWREVQRSLELAPDSPHIAYHSAVVAEITGRRSEAVRLLEKAFTAGFPTVEAERDPELAELRSLPEWNELTKRTRRAEL